MKPASSKINRLNEEFRQYLLQRGYKVPLEPLDVLHGWWVRSFAQPSFAQFWRIWNPFIGFWLLKLYRKLGGDDYRIFACLLTFLIAGFCHDLFGFAFDPADGFEPELTIAFLFWGVLVLLMSSRTVLKFLRKLPVLIQVILNLTWIWAGIILGEWLD